MPLVDLAGRYGELARALRQGTEGQLQHDILSRSTADDVRESLVYPPQYPHADWLSRNARALITLTDTGNSTDEHVRPEVAELWRKWRACHRPKGFLRLPVACVQPDAICFLTFWGEEVAGSGAMAPTPDTALMFLEHDLIAAVEGQHRSGWNVWWDLECPTEMGARRFAGDSLGGAAAVGMWLLTRGQVPDPGFLIIARVEGDRLLPARGEVEKVKAAIRSGVVRRLGLPEGHGLAAQQIHGFQQSLVVYDKLVTVEQAAKEASSFPFPVTGPVDMSDSRYVEDMTDREALKWARDPREMVYSLHAPNQTGKTTLLHHMVATAQETGQRTVIVSGETLSFNKDLNSLLFRFVGQLRQQLRSMGEWAPPANQESNWVDWINPCLESAMAADGSPLLIAFDDTARLIDSQAGEQFFSMMRGWTQVPANRGRLRLLLMTSVNPSRLIKNLLLSPFNGVGLHKSIKWNRWDDEAVRKLHSLYCKPLGSDEEGLSLLRTWAGSHPYLNQVCLHALTKVPGRDPVEIWRTCVEAQGHLRRLEAQLEENQALKAAFRMILSRRAAPKADTELLEAMGLCGSPYDSFTENGAAGPVELSHAEVSCGLYRWYFESRL